MRHFILLCALFYPTLGSGQTPTQGGITSCVGGQPVSTIHPGWTATAPGYGAPHSDSVTSVIHEEIHIQQLYGNCDSIHAVWDASSHARVEAEAEAECMAERLTFMSDSARAINSIRWSQFYSKFLGRISFVEAYEKFGRWCNSR